MISDPYSMVGEEFGNVAYHTNSMSYVVSYINYWLIQSDPYSLVGNVARYCDWEKKHQVPSMANLFHFEVLRTVLQFGQEIGQTHPKAEPQNRVDITLKYTWQGWPNGRSFGERNLPPLHSLAHYFTTGATSGVLSRHARAA